MTIEIAVLNVAERPVGLSDHFSTSYIDVLRVHGSGVLNNDFDPDGDMLTFRFLSGTSSGVLAFTSDGEFDYTPHAGFVGQVTFAYVAFDGVLESEPIVVTIDVVLPANVASPGSGSGGPSDNGGGNSTPTGALGETSKVTDLPLSTSGVETDGFQGSRTVRSTGGSEVGRLELRDGRRVGDFRAALSERVTGIDIDQWTTKHSYEDLENYRRREEAVKSDLIWAYGSHGMLDAFEPTRAEMNLEQVVTTVIASGVILFALQASQILATLITSAPSWIHVDIESTLDRLQKEKNAGDEASAKIFEKQVQGS